MFGRADPRAKRLERKTRIDGLKAVCYVLAQQPPASIQWPTGSPPPASLQICHVPLECPPP